MKNRHRFGRQFAIVAILSAAAIPDAYSAPPADGGALVESCAACHGTDTNSREGFENLRGEGNLDELLEMKYRMPAEGIMDWVARTYTDAQLTTISNYLATH